MIEVEVKLPVRELEEIKKQLMQNGFAETAHLRERDTYFDNVADRIRSGGQALRIRETADFKAGTVTAQINFKGKKQDPLTMTRQELESTVDQAEICRQILESIGFHRVFPEVIKERTMLQQGDMAACLDQVENLGSFLELEILVPDEAQRVDAQNRIAGVLAMLGYCMTDTVRSSYLSMLQKKEVF